ncbi:MAG: TldD/PmbA family protein [Methanopyri archaeon]|nr:TldD/PmbA family protein [Methanopyri archaeon]
MGDVERVFEEAEEEGVGVVVVRVEDVDVTVERTADAGDKGSYGSSSTIVVRVVSDDGLGVSAVSGGEDPVEAFRRALIGARLGCSDPVDYPDEVSGCPVECFDGSAVEQEVLWDVLEGLEAEASVDGVEVTGVTVSGSVSRVEVWTSPDGPAVRETSSVGASVEVVGEFSGWSYDQVVGPGDVDVEGLAEEAVEMASEEPREAPPSGEVTVCFHPRAWAELVAYTLIPALSGLNVVKGLSAFSRDDLGERVGPPGFTLINDATLDGWPGSYPFDDEGVEARRTVLVEDGILKGFYTDLYSGGRLGIGSTGSGLGAMRPSPSPANVVMEGDVESDGLIEEADIVVMRVLGAHTASQVSGRFSVTGLWVEDPDGGRVKPVTIRGNVMGGLKSAEVSRDGDRIGSLRSPYVKMTCRVG